MGLPKFRAFGGHADDDAADLLASFADLDGNPDGEIIIDDCYASGGRAYYFDRDGFLHRLDDNGDTPIVGYLRSDLFKLRTR